MKRAAVLGHPIGHSLSPKLHGYWLNKLAIDGSYEAIDTSPEFLGERLTQLMDQGYQGVNLTVPLKEHVITLLDETSSQAQHIGAVNTVIFKHGKLYGDNTDAYGFIENLRSGVKDLSPYLSHAVVLGAGGAARAIIAGLLAEGVVQITLLNRTREKAEILAKMHPSIHVKNWENRSEALSQASLVVNTTSLGMKNQPALELSLEFLPKTALVTDIVYNPLETALLKQANERGNSTVDGLGMLIYQAVPAFEAFFGMKPTMDEKIRMGLL
ncbi:MAG: shikimate dehydrogenase [Rickettsiales bacterium]|nr:shikimate dehydrogenase [Rickettsiales bacterium]